MKRESRLQIPPHSRRAQRQRKRKQRLVRTGVSASVIVLLIVFVLPRLFRGGGKPAVAASPALVASPSPSRAVLAPLVGATPTALGLPPRLTITSVAQSLPATLSEAPAVPSGSGILLLGGLAPAGPSAAVLQFSPAVSNTVSGVGTLAVPTEDAGATIMGQSAVVFGGLTGEPTAATTTVQTFGPAGAQVLGHLPHPRIGLSVVSVGGHVYLLGGSDGVTDSPDILETTDGRHFSAVTQLPIAVSNPGVAVVGTTIYVVGGKHQGVPIPQVQAVNLLTATAAVVSTLPVAISDESVFIVGGALFVAGGRTGVSSRTEVDSLDPGTGRLTRAGVLPEAMADASVGQIGNDVYLFGGQAPAQLRIIVHISIAAASPGPSAPGVRASPTKGFPTHLTPTG